MNRQRDLLVTILYIFVVAVVLAVIGFLANKHKPSQAEHILFGASTTTADSLGVNEWPIQTLTELYARLDRRILTGNE